MNEDNKKRLQARIPDGYWKGIDIGEGWEQLVLDLDAELAEIDPDYVLAQVKEKFGGLRYYAHLSTVEAQPIIDLNGKTVSGRTESGQAFRDAIARAESASYKICEVCGEPGVLREGGWIRTLCDAHAKGQPAINEEWRDTFGA